MTDRPASETSFVKLEGEQVADTIEEVNIFAAIEEDAKGLAVALLRFNEHLTADTAGASGLRREGSVRAAGRNGYGCGSNVGVVCVGGEHRTSLSANRGRIGRVLLITSLNDFAILQTDRSAYAEV